MFGGGGGGGLFGSVAAPGQGFGGVGGQGANPNQSKSGDINLGTCPDSISSVCAGHWASPNVTSQHVLHPPACDMLVSGSSWCRGLWVLGW